jgi:uncharacterized membrane protein YhaH (DUF805 family)
MNIFSYQDRIGRQKYIIGLIGAAILSVIIEFLYFFIVLSSITLALSKNGFLSIIFVFLLGIIIALIPVFLTSTIIVKRFHDVGKSGKWWFALLIPIYNIHLSIGLLTERGAAGPNLYGEDTLPPNTQDDIFNRFSQNQVARVVIDILVIGLCLLSFALSIMSDVKSKVQQQTTQQNFLNQPINTDTGQPFPNEKSNIVAQSTTNNLFTALKPPVDIGDISNWKSVLVKIDFSTLNLGSSVVCYTIKYPANLFYAELPSYSSTEWFMTTHYNGVSSMNAIYVDAEGGDGDTISKQLFSDANSDELAFTSVYKQGYGLKGFDTTSGLHGQELTGGKGLWSIYIPISEKSGDVVLKMAPSLMINNTVPDVTTYGNTFYDSTLGEAMAKTIQASACPK